MRRLPEWLFPAGFFGVAILLVVALYMVGSGIHPDYQAEVHDARGLLFEPVASPEERRGVEAALRTLDPAAVAEAER